MHSQQLNVMLIGSHDLSYTCVSPTFLVSTIAIVNIICSCTHRQELPCSRISILSKLCGAHSVQKNSSYKHKVLDTPPPKCDFLLPYKSCSFVKLDCLYMKIEVWSAIAHLKILDHLILFGGAWGGNFDHIHDTFSGVNRSISVASSAKSAWVFLLETNEAFRFGP